MQKKSKLHIAILPGDGIGLEVMEAVLPLFSAISLPITYEKGDIGWSCWVKDGDPVPQATWDLIKRSDATLLGAITSKPQREAQAEQPHGIYTSPLIQLRQQLDLYANVRPCFSIKQPQAFQFCVIRENTEGLYSGLDFDHLPPDFMPTLSQYPQWAQKTHAPLSCTLRIQSQAGLKRIFEFAFQYAMQNQYTRVSYADKPNVLRNSSAFARSIFENIAQRYPQIQADILNVDAVAMHLVTKPQSFGVIVTENMFGDILSDVAAGVMGGLGLAASANIGAQHAYFEPVHGSGPRMQPHTANPSAMFLTIALLLSHFGYDTAAKHIQQAVKQVILNNKHVTRDLGGNASTQAMAEAIIQEAKKYDYTV